MPSRIGQHARLAYLAVDAPVNLRRIAVCLPSLLLAAPPGAGVPRVCCAAAVTAAFATCSPLLASSAYRTHASIAEDVHRPKSLILSSLIPAKAIC